MPGPIREAGPDSETGSGELSGVPGSTGEADPETASGALWDSPVEEPESGVDLEELCKAELEALCDETGAEAAAMGKGVGTPALG